METALKKVVPPDATVQVESPPQISSGLAVTRVVMYWLAFVVVIGVLPILLQAGINHFSSKGVDWTDLLGKGELLLISAVIGGATLGEVFESGRRERAEDLVGWKATIQQFIKDFAYIAALITTLLCVIFAVAIYGILVVFPDLTGANARHWSEVLFGITVTACAIVIGSVRKL